MINNLQYQLITNNILACKGGHGCESCLKLRGLGLGLVFGVFFDGTYVEAQKQNINIRQVC